jgi:hypothetical protein
MLCKHCFYIMYTWICNLTITLLYDYIFYNILLDLIYTLTEQII